MGLYQSGGGVECHTLRIAKSHFELALISKSGMRATHNAHMRNGQDVGLVIWTLIEIGSNADRHLVNAFPTIRFCACNVSRPIINFTSGNVVPSASFPAPEVDLLQTWIDLERTVEAFGQPARQRRAA